MKGETITQTEYVVRIVTPKSAPETNRRWATSSRRRLIERSAGPYRRLRRARWRTIFGPAGSITVSG